jgi:hypothetical protein
MTLTPAATAARVTDGLMARATPPGASLVLASRHGPTDDERWRRSERRAAHATRRTRPPRDAHVRQRLRPRPVRVDSDGASDGEATEDSDKNNGRDKAPGNRCDAATAAERAAQSHDETLPLRRRAPAAMGKRGQRVAPRTAHETQKQATSYELRIDRIDDEARKTGDGSAGPATGETAENESVARGPRRCRRRGGGGGQETGGAAGGKVLQHGPHAARSVGRDQLMRPRRSGAKKNNKATTLARVKKRHKTIPKLTQTQTQI